MSIWTAFVIVQATMGQPVELHTNEGPLSIVAQTQDAPKPEFEMNVGGDPAHSVDRIIGVQAQTYVNTATVTTLQFTTKELCEAALVTLQKQGGVHSVSCVQTSP